MSVKEQPNLTVTLDSGIVIEYPPQLDGGGLEQRFDFLNAIQKSGKLKYHRTFEWCAGFGVIGFEILGRGLTDELYFSDCFELAIQNCQLVAEKNNISNRVFGYVSSSIVNLPKTELWDLVVSNPPHQSDKTRFINGLMENNNHTNISELTDLDVALRVTVDEDLNIHKEFFKNIQGRLTDDADIFISITEPPELINSIAEENNFQLVEKHTSSFNNGYSMILHYKFKRH